MTWSKHHLTQMAAEKPQQSSLTSDMEKRDNQQQQQQQQHNSTSDNHSTGLGQVSNKVTSQHFPWADSSVRSLCLWRWWSYDHDKCQEWMSLIAISGQFQTVAIFYYFFKVSPVVGLPTAVEVYWPACWNILSLKLFLLWLKIFIFVWNIYERCFLIKSLYLRNVNYMFTVQH